MVRRIYVEKKPALRQEAAGLLNELRSLLGISALTGLRLLNRYDVEGLDEETFQRAVQTVFSEPQVDTVSAALPAGDTCLTLTVELFGPYDSAAAFARDCYTLTALAKQCTVPPEKLHFTWDALSAAESSLNTGSLLYTEDYSLDLSGAVQLDWTVQQMEQQTETEYLLDAENIPDED